MRPVTLLLAVLVAVPFWMPLFPASPDPPQSGDWVITTGESVVKSGGTLLLNGSLIVDGGGTLVLDGVTLLLDPPSPLNFSIEVRQGGRLDLNGSAVTSVSPANPYRFAVLAGGAVNLTNSTVERCGFAGAATPDGLGLYIAAPAAVENLTVSGCAAGMVVDGAAVTVRNSTLRGNAAVGLLIRAGGNVALVSSQVNGSGADGIRVEDSTLKLVNSTVSSSAGSGFAVAGFSAVEVSGSTISDNGRSATTGGGIRVSSGGSGTASVRIEGSRLAGNSPNGLHITDAAGHAVDGYNLTFSGNTGRDVLLSDEAGQGGAGARATLVNSTLASVAVTAGSGEARVGWWVAVTSRWQSSGGPAGGNSLSVFDSKGSQVVSTVFDQSGRAGPFALYEYSASGGGMTNLTPHTFLARSGARYNQSSAGISGNGVVGLLIDDVPPPLVITSPANGTVTGLAAVNITGRTEAGARVFINGTETPLAPNGTFSARVALAGEGGNRFEVAAQDSSLNLAVQSVVIVRDTAAPGIVLQSPNIAPGEVFLTNLTSVEVSGTTEPGAAVSLGAGSITAGTDGYFSFVYDLPGDGAYNLTLTARDAAGNFGTLSFSVRRDTLPPPLALAQPAGNLLTNQSVVVVSGATEPGAVLTVAGTPVTPSPEGFFLVEVPLPADGAYNISVEATDAVGNRNSITFAVVLDTVPPALAIETPAPRALLNSTILTVSGTSEEGAAVTVNGTPATAGAGGRFSASLNLSEGAGAIVVAATDRAGNRREARVVVIVDTTPPLLAVLSPANGSLVARRTLTITGTTESGAWIEVGAARARASGGGFAVEVALSEGTNTFRVVARDEAGNARAATLVVVSDTTPPALNVESPRDRLEVTAPSVLVEGVVEAGANLSVNGAAVNHSGGRFSVPVPLKIGENRIALTAVDAAGNAAGATVTVVRVARGGVAEASVPYTYLAGGVAAGALIAGIVVAWRWTTGKKRRAADEEE